MRIAKCWQLSENEIKDRKIGCPDDFDCPVSHATSKTPPRNSARLAITFDRADRNARSLNVVQQMAR